MKMTNTLPRVGDIVRVRSKEEILSTLDSDGCLGGLPFMPQMFAYCGERLSVVARAHKTCDVIAGRGRGIEDCVHLDVRCDGEAYGGCQAGCLIFWKLAWLEVAAQEADDSGTGSRESRSADSDLATCTEADVWRATHSGEPASEAVYFCQAMRVPDFTTPLPWWHVGQYVEDYSSGNATLGRLGRGLAYQLYTHGTWAWRHRFGRPARWVYDKSQASVKGIPYPRKPGTLPPGGPAPVEVLNLQPGELVRVKPHEEILATITAGGMNRGLLFDKEMVPFSGRTFRVRTRVEIFVDERTGES